MTDLKRERNRLNCKRWRAKHPEKVRTYVREYMRKYRAEHPEELRAYQRAYQRKRRAAAKEAPAGAQDHV